MSSLHHELKGQFEIFKSIPFPLDSSDDELSEIHAELADFDGYITGLVDTLLAYRSAIAIQYDQALEERIRSALQRKEGGDFFQVDQYLKYILVIKKLANLAQKYSTQLRGV